MIENVSRGGRPIAELGLDGLRFHPHIHVHVNIGHVIRDVGHVVRGAVGELQGVISLIPGIGTGISSAIAAGLTTLSGGSPIDIALNAAFGAIPIPPGLHDVAHAALEAAVKLAQTRGNVGAATISAARDQLPDGFPRHVFDTLVHIIVHHRTKKPTIAVKTATQTIPLTDVTQVRALAREVPNLRPAPPGAVAPVSPTADSGDQSTAPNGTVTPTSSGLSTSAKVGIGVAVAMVVGGDRCGRNLLLCLAARCRA